MVAGKRDRRPICHCKLWNFPHKHDWRRCAEPERDDGDDYAQDHKLDDPRRGQADGINRMNRREI